MAGARTSARETALSIRWFFPIFFLSGACALVYQVVWLRLAMARYGVTAPLVAIVLSVFMAGIAAGSLLAGRCARRAAESPLALPLRLYGAALHRARSRAGAVVEAPPPALWGALAVAALLPLLAADPWLGTVENPSLSTPAEFAVGALRVALGILPFCLLAGYLTPRLVDAGARGDPARAARAYAVNLAGCIAGPLTAGFLLLPRVDERAALALLALPLLALALLGQSARAAVRTLLPAGLAAAALLVATRDAATQRGPHRIRRDYAATSIATGEGMERRLLVNGFGMTRLTPITKMMAHLSLALLDRPPESALVVCFGMGTTFRSLASWRIDTTGVELIPGVVELFDYFHPDARTVLASPAGARVVVDDGRRFLERTDRKFDVITIDPPPPVMAAGSSLLYSRQFYAVAAGRLRPGGILHRWLPGGDDVVVTSFTRALAESFPHVRAFGSLERWGIHFLASDHPIGLPSRDELGRRLPPEAQRDLLEWTPGASVEGLFGRVFSREFPIEELLARSPRAPALSDDRPFNEYYLLRAIGAPGGAR